MSKLGTAMDAILTLSIVTAVGVGLAAPAIMVGFLAWEIGRVVAKVVGI